MAQTCFSTYETEKPLTYVEMNNQEEVKDKIRLEMDVEARSQRTM